jgi:anti-sigma factor ChrR (cupin superfamily)
MGIHPQLEQAEAYVLGALPGSACGDFEAHLAACALCRDAVAGLGPALLALTDGIAEPPAPEVRAAVLELAQAPSLPLDFGAYAWEERAPGFRTAFVREAPELELVSWLVWAQPGARYPAHRHKGDETTLVLQGSCRDAHGTHSAGALARMRAGSAHQVEFLPDEDCIAYLVAFRGHELVEG